MDKSLKYSAVAFRDRILVSYRGEQDPRKFEEIKNGVNSVLQKFGDTLGFAKVLELKAIRYGIYTKDNVNFLCVVPQQVSKSLVRQYLREVSDAFFLQYSSVTEQTDCSAFAPRLLSIARETKDKITELKKMVNETTEIITKDLQKIDRRGEDLRHLARLSETSVMISQRFAKESSALKKKLWYQTVKAKLLIAFIILIIIGITYFLVCPGGNCTKSKK